MDLKFRVELNVLKHLGIGLYSSTPSVITEIIANAWDADAKNVNITLDPDHDVIIVNDDGHGMSESDIQDKFLAVGYSRRTRELNGDSSQGGSRKVMGRKGIGKLAMFSLAKEIEVVTKRSSETAIAFSLDVDALLEKAEKAHGTADYSVTEIPVPADFTSDHGTRIKLTHLNNRINRTESYLRPRLARRFSVFSDQFVVKLNGTEIKRTDAGFHSDIQFLWAFDTPAKDLMSSLCDAIATYGESTPPEKCIGFMDSDIHLKDDVFELTGYIASADKPAKLGKGDESLNKISVFANGRLFQEDILQELGDARYFNSYLIGEIHADFLDNDNTDRATASRESIRHEDERFQALRTHLKGVLKVIRDQWDDWRAEQGYENAPEKNPKVEEWLSSLNDPRDKKAADRLMSSIEKVVLHNDEDKNSAAKKLLYRSAIVGFEKLRAKNRLDALEKITDVTSPEFQAIFTSLDDVEESYYLDIVTSRLEIIRKFDEEIVDLKKQEKVAQNYLFDHLWLLDPSWDRVIGSEEIERTLTKELRRACPDSDQGARLDIAYRTTAGRHIIIELKRPGLYVPADKLEAQGRKYIEALEQWYREHPDAAGLFGRLPPIDVYFLVAKAPELNERESKSWAAFNLRVMTYQGLITNARMSYQSYIDIRRDVAGKLGGLLDQI